MATYDLTSVIPSKIKTGDILNCPYSGSAKQITLPKGQYKLECWGAQGGDYNTTYIGGRGGYSTGIIILKNKTTKLFLYSGGQGIVYSGSTNTTDLQNGGFNGGGKGTRASGGGASDIRLNTDSLYARLIVSGGGGGAGYYNGSYYGSGGSGGGLNGYAGTYQNKPNTNSAGQGGTQTTGGAAGTETYHGAGGNGNFGAGGNSANGSGYFGGGGGGGWYGGGGASYGGAYGEGGGGGGSGYIYTSSTASNYPSGCLLNSSYYLTNAQTIAGNTAFTSPIGTSETGHTGNGYIRITVIEVSSGNTLVKTTSNTWKEQKQMFINTGASTTIPSGLVELEYIQSSGTQYIDTGFKPNQNTRVVMDVTPVDVSLGEMWCAFGVRQNDIYFGLYKASTGNMNLTWFYGSNYSNYFTVDYAKRHNLEVNKNAASVDGISKSYAAQTFQFTIPLFLLCDNAAGSPTSAGAALLYSCQIYDNGTLIRDFIPAKRMSDGKCGLWDKVNFKFYTDENGGNFTAGTEKTAIAAIGTPLEYIESTGTQYLDTGITVNKNDNKELIMSCQLGNDGSYAGANGYMQYQASITGGAKGILKISYKNNIETIYFNDVLKLTQDWTSAYSGTNVKLGIFKLGETNNTWYNSSAQQIGKLYYYKLYDNGTLIRDFIPVKRITDNKYGLWDKVNKIFYSNAGTGTFTGGPAITLTGWHKIKGVWAKTTADTWSQAL